MKCEYCGNKYKKAKYGNYCKHCYAPPSTTTYEIQSVSNYVVFPDIGGAGGGGGIDVISGVLYDKTTQN